MGSWLQDCSTSIDNAMEILQFCTKPWIYDWYDVIVMILSYNRWEKSYALSYDPFYKWKESIQLKLTWWRHQVEAFSTLLAICAGNSPVSGVNSPHKGQWRRDLIFSLICAWINGWVNNCEAGDWRRHHAHYDVTVRKACESSLCSNIYSVNPIRSQLYTYHSAAVVAWLNVASLFPY